MSEEKVLTKEIAEQHIASQEPDLSEYTTINDDAAEALAAFEGELLLDDLNAISDQSAQLLSKHKGYLQIDYAFDDTTNMDLSDKAAEFLASHENFETNNKKLKNFSGKALSFEIKDYQKISPTNADGEVLSVNDPGGVFTDEADFIFDGVQIHIASVENNAGRKIFINHKYSVEDMNDEFLKLFTEVVGDKLVEGLEDGFVDLEMDWYMDVEEIQNITKHYRDFLQKFKTQ
jgi:hypothetical protein